MLRREGITYVFLSVRALVCMRGFLVYSCIRKVVMIFVCILCIKKMLPGNFQILVMSKHSGFAVN